MYKRQPLLIGGLSFALAAILNAMGVRHMGVYALLGMVLWTAVLKSGVHATLAGVLIALCIPLAASRGHSPLRWLEHRLHRPVAFVILPIFAFANAGLDLRGLTFEQFSDPVMLGVALGLLVGKPVGILGLVYLGVALGWARLPAGATWGQVAGIAFACGIGFTMSLFIASLAFDSPGVAENLQADRLGILLGSLVSACAAAIILHFTLPRVEAPSEVST